MTVLLWDVYTKIILLVSYYYLRFLFLEILQEIH